MRVRRQAVAGPPASEPPVDARAGPGVCAITASAARASASGRRPTSPSSCEGITKRFPGVVANQRHRPHGAPRHGPRDRRRERRRQVDPDEDPLRHAAARRGHDRGRRRAGHLPLARRRDRAPASAWCTSTSCWPTTSPSSRTSSSAPRSCTASATAARARDPARSPTRTASSVDPDALVEDLGVGDRQRVEILKVLYRGARILILDEPTAVLVPAGGRRAVRQPARAEGRGPDRHLHLPQARRGAARSPTRSPSSGAAPPSPPSTRRASPPASWPS